jgi:uncharacterized protein (TIRG00374 family)
VKIKRITLFKIVISLAILTLLLTRINLIEAWNQLQNLSLPFIFFALLYYAGCQWLSCWRWQLVLRATGYSIPMMTLLSSYFIGMFVNIFLPGSIGGDVYRVYRVAQKTQDSEAALASVFLERFTGLASLSMIALLALPAAFRLVGRWDIIILLITCIVTLMGGTLLIASYKLLAWAEPWLIKLHLGSFAVRFAKIQIFLHKFAQNRRALVLSMVLSLLLQLAIVYYFYMVANQLKIPISSLELLVFIPIITVVAILPISLGGLGLREGLWVYLFTRVDLNAEQAILLSLTTTLLNWFVSFFGAVILGLDAAGIEVLKKSRVD